MSIITALRNRLHITQAVLANAIGVTPGRVGHYEKGQPVPPKVAKKLIEFAAKHAESIAYDDLYGKPNVPVPRRRRKDRQPVEDAA